MFSNIKNISFNFLDSHLIVSNSTSVSYSDVSDKHSDSEHISNARKLFKIIERVYSNLNIKSIISVYRRMPITLDHYEHMAGMTSDADSAIVLDKSLDDLANTSAISGIENFREVKCKIFPA